MLELYLRFLAREPNDKELALCVEHMHSVNNRARGSRDIVWTLVNRTEFLHRN